MKYQFENLKFAKRKVIFSINLYIFKHWLPGDRIFKLAVKVVHTTLPTCYTIVKSK